jgi:hypothetical protein
VSEVDRGNAIPQGGHGLALRLVQGDKLAELAQTLAQGNRPVQVLPRGDEPGVGVDAEGAVFGLGEGRPSKYGGDATPCLRCPSRSRQIPNIAEDVRTVAREGLLWNIGRSQPDCTTTRGEGPRGTIGAKPSFVCSVEVLKPCRTARGMWPTCQ